MKFKVFNGGFGKKTPVFLFSLFMFITMAVFPASGEVSGWEISPANPVAGDTIQITGSASPREEVGFLVYFEEDVPVIGGTYTYELQNVEVPDFNNCFSVRAEGVEDLYVRGKLVLWRHRGTKANEGVAVLSAERIPPGAYQLKLDGNSKNGETRVKLKVTALQVVKADSEGKFSYTYNTGSVPPGKYEITAGNYAVTFTLQPEGRLVSDPSCTGTAQKIQGSRITLMPETDPVSESTSVIGTAQAKSTSLQEEAPGSLQEQTPGSRGSENPETPGMIENLENSGIIENLEKIGIIGDGIYMLGGIGVGIIFLFAYSRKIS
ncbi:TPA: hypothetical protein HA351_15500 [Methanosarcinaceae archaeon]|nr:hypothetical protein [Methanosarcinaceae archaeon]